MVYGRWTIVGELQKFGECASEKTAGIWEMVIRDSYDALECYAEVVVVIVAVKIVLFFFSDFNEEIHIILTIL